MANDMTAPAPRVLGLDLSITATGIDLDARNADLARERLGMFLDIDQSPVKETP